MYELLKRKSPVLEIAKRLSATTATVTQRFFTLIELGNIARHNSMITTAEARSPIATTGSDNQSGCVNTNCANPKNTHSPNAFQLTQAITSPRPSPNTQLRFQRDSRRKGIIQCCLTC